MTDEEPLSHADAIAEVTDGLSFGPWIDGRPAETAETFETIDPATHEPIAAVGRGDASHVDRAVSAAWDAYDREWAKTTYADRARRLVEWIETLRDHAEELTRLECLDTGKPIGDTRAEVEGAIDTLEYYASIARGERGAQIPATENTHIYTRREPYGVVGQIV
ncbi:MAG: aldehyde dehydrogenase family protein, partial [Natronomonas sp.]|nr:aldehyde dehydrogenase family protein [Natronomonas sp.]